MFALNRKSLKKRK